MATSPILFIDANIWYSAFFKSPNCFKITEAHSLGVIQAAVSEQILSEVFSNVGAKIPHILPTIHEFLAKSPPVVIKSYPSIPPTFNSLAHPKDLPLIVSCHHARIAYFVTGNAKHFKIDSINKTLGISILSPSQAVKQFKL